MALGATSNGLTVNSGLLDVQGYSLTVGTLGGAGGTILSNSAGSAPTLTVNMASGSSTYGGSLANGTGTLALIKAGGGTLVLSGSNTYSGGTNVAGGILAATTTASLPKFSIPGTLAVQSGTVLDLSAGGTGQFQATDINNLRYPDFGEFQVGPDSTMGTLGMV